MTTAGQPATRENANPEGTAAPKQQAPVSPNDNWQTDPNLDANGNPKEGFQTYPSGKPDGEQPPADPQGDPKPETPSSKPEAPAEPEVKYSSEQAEQIKSFIDAADLDVDATVAEVNKNGVTPEIMEALVEKHGEAVANLIAGQMEGLAEQRKAETAAKDKAVFDLVSEAFKDITDQSGEESWKELAKWSKDNFTKEQRAEVNGMLEQGGLAAELATKHLIESFKGSDQYQQPAQLQTETNIDTGEVFTPITKSEYTMKLRELEGKGHVYGESTEMKRLDAQRMKSMQRGY